MNKHLHFAADNAIPVSTPQIYLGKQRLCDEDTDMGLRFTLRQLAPEVLPVTPRPKLVAPALAGVR